MEIYGFICQGIGELLIAVTVLRVHSRVVKDEKVDKAVLRAMRLEQGLGHIGVIFLVVGIVIQLRYFR